MDLSDVPKDCIIEAYEELDRLLTAELQAALGDDLAFPGLLRVEIAREGFMLTPPPEKS